MITTVDRPTPAPLTPRPEGHPRLTEWRFIGRFTALPASGNGGSIIARKNRLRLQLRCKQIGAGSVQISHLPTPVTTTGGEAGWPLAQNESETFGVPPWGPTNTFYAIGVGVHDLYVYELVEMTPGPGGAIDEE